MENSLDEEENKKLAAMDKDVSEGEASAVWKEQGIGRKVTGIDTILKLGIERVRVISFSWWLFDLDVFELVFRSATVMSGEAAAAGEVEMEVVEVATCEFCGLTEDCTLAYIARVREMYRGLWLCGLCGEAVEEEIKRSGQWMSRDEAITQHGSFLRNFQDATTSPVNPTQLLIVALRRLVRRILDSPQTSNGPHRQVEVASANLARF